MPATVVTDVTVVILNANWYDYRTRYGCRHLIAEGPSHRLSAKVVARADAIATRTIADIRREIGRTRYRGDVAPAIVVHGNVVDVPTQRHRPWTILCAHLVMEPQSNRLGSEWRQIYCATEKRFGRKCRCRIRSYFGTNVLVESSPSRTIC